MNEYENESVLVWQVDDASRAGVDRCRRNIYKEVQKKEINMDRIQNKGSRSIA